MCLAFEMTLVEIIIKNGFYAKLVGRRSHTENTRLLFGLTVRETMEMALESSVFSHVNFMGVSFSFFSFLIERENKIQ